MNFKRFGLIIFIVFFSLINAAFAQERELLYASNQSDALKEIVKKIQDVKSAKMPYADLKSPVGYFVRIAPRQYTVDDKNQIKDSAILGTKPVVFITTPESVYGKSLLDVYLDIGYEAEDIIGWQNGVDMVAIVFAYPNEITLSDVKNGQLSEQWKKAVHVPTWDNMYAIFNKLAKESTVEPDKKGEFAPEKLFFKSEEEKNFVLNFPSEGKERIKTIPYAVLKAENKSDWQYRRLLENKLSLFEHFRGNGRTQNEIVDRDGTRTEIGVLEFVAPNWKLKELPEIAIIHLGKLSISDTYTTDSSK